MRSKREIKYEIDKYKKELSEMERTYDDERTELERAISELKWVLG